MLKGLSRERVAMELLGLLALPDPLKTLRQMKTLGVLGVVLPETCQPGLTALERLLKAEQDACITPDPIRRLAALLPAHIDTAEALAASLRLSRSQRARLVSPARTGRASGRERVGKDG